MTRFNYLAARRVTSAPIGPTLAIDNRLRGPFAALAATLVLTVAISVVQLTRLQCAQRAYAATALRITAQTRAVEEIRLLRARVAQKTLVVEHVAAVRRKSRMQANELAWIGNHLPPDTWLRALRFEAGGYSLEGSAQRVSAVGGALLALRDTDRGTVPQLVGLHDDSGRGVRVHYTLRLVTGR